MGPCWRGDGFAVGRLTPPVAPPTGPQSPELCETTRGGAPFPDEVISVLRVHTPLPDMVETKVYSCAPGGRLPNAASVNPPERAALVNASAWPNIAAAWRSISAEIRCIIANGESGPNRAGIGANTSTGAGSAAGIAIGALLTLTCG